MNWKSGTGICYTAIVVGQSQFCLSLFFKVKAVHSKNQAPHEHLSDEALLTQVAQGDSTALEILYDRHAATILAILIQHIGERIAAEGLLQETFWQVWQRAHTYRSHREPFRNWLYRTAMVLAIYNSIRMGDKDSGK